MIHIECFTGSNAGSQHQHFLVAEMISQLFAWTFMIKKTDTKHLFQEPVFWRYVFVCVCVWGMGGGWGKRA